MCIGAGLSPRHARYAHALTSSASLFLFLPPDGDGGGGGACHNSESNVHQRVSSSARLGSARPDTRSADEAQLTHRQGEGGATHYRQVRQEEENKEEHEEEVNDTLLPCLRRGFACLRRAELLGAGRPGLSAILAGDARAGILRRTQGLRH